jgi:chromosome partitioning protein
MTKIIAVWNADGGVGKSTITMNLGCELGRSGKKVLLVDLDSQAALTKMMGDVPNPSVNDLLEGVSLHLVKQHLHGVDLVAADASLVSAEIKMVTVLVNREKMLSEALEEASEYDYVLIDCAPAKGLLTMNALIAADAVIMPVLPDEQAVTSLNDARVMLSTIDKARPSPLPTMGVIVNQMDRRVSLSEQIFEDVRKICPKRGVAENHTGYVLGIKQNVSIKRAVGAGVPVRKYNRRAVGTREFTELAAWFMATAKQMWGA